MATTAIAPQMNGVPPSSADSGSGSQTIEATQSQQAQTSQVPSAPQSQPLLANHPPPQSQPPPQVQQHAPIQHHHPLVSGAMPPTSPAATAPRPRDARTLELLLTAQGVTSFEERVPLLLLDFAYRHTSSILSDALHLSADPYTSHAGARPSATSGAAPVNAGDAAVSASAVQLAIASRLGYQFRGGGGGAAKDWMMDMAKERNKIALPRVAAAEWGVRLPSERFVLSGVSWGLKDVWARMADREGDEEEEEDLADGGDAMEGVENTGGAAEEEDVGGEDVEGGTAEDLFGRNAMEDEDMEAE